MDEMLKNRDHLSLLRSDGAVVFPFLLPKELESIRDFYNSIRNAYDLPFTQGMHMTLWHKDHIFKRSIQDGILSRLQAAYDRHFTASRRLNNIFIIKQAHTDADFAMHNDWSVVDEEKYESLNVWIPLEDTTTANGALWVIKGSHKMDMPLRGGGALLPDFSQVSEALSDYKTFLPARAGDAIVFYHKTVHGSGPNMTGTDRVICTFSLLPSGAALRICFQRDVDSPLEIYEPPDDFNYYYDDLLSDTNLRGPAGGIKEVHPPYKQKKITMDDILPHIVKG